MNQFKFIDLFAGIGGFRVALESLGGDCVFSSEFDSHAQKTYYQNFSEIPSGDITMIDENSIPDHDILTAGFPCQPFSIAGKRKGFNDTRGTLFFDVARIIKEKKPKLILLENVAGLVSHDSGNTLSVIEETIMELGYNHTWKLLNAKDYGIPQNRNRWYLIAFRNDLKIGSSDMIDIFPEKKALDYQLIDVLEDGELNEYRVSETAIKNIEANLPKFSEKNPSYQENILIANNVRPSKVSFSANNISPCLTAKMGTGGNNVPILVHKKRKLTERECLRIMGFPDSYQIDKNTMQSYKQIGNSIAVPVVTAILENAIKILKLKKIGI